jgi:hypothetical protein
MLTLLLLGALIPIHIAGVAWASQPDFGLDHGHLQRRADPNRVRPLLFGRRDAAPPGILPRNSRPLHSAQFINKTVGARFMSSRTKPHGAVLGQTRNGLVASLRKRPTFVEGQPLQCAVQRA